ncbi:MAG: hypothetical protein QM760_16145 [Nibricoccus sp.]
MKRVLGDHAAGRSQLLPQAGDLRQVRQGAMHLGAGPRDVSL